MSHGLAAGVGSTTLAPFQLAGSLCGEGLLTGQRSA